MDSNYVSFSMFKFPSYLCSQFIPFFYVLFYHIACILLYYTPVHPSVIGGKTDRLAMGVIEWAEQKKQIEPGQTGTYG